MKQGALAGQSLLYFRCTKYRVTASHTSEMRLQTCRYVARATPEGCPGRADVGHSEFVRGPRQKDDRHSQGRASSSYLEVHRRTGGSSCIGKICLGNILSLLWRGTLVHGIRDVETHYQRLSLLWAQLERVEHGLVPIFAETCKPSRRIKRCPRKRQPMSKSGFRRYKLSADSQRSLGPVRGMYGMGTPLMPPS